MSNAALVQDGHNKEEPLSTLKVVTKPIPKATPGHVVVHITLRPINPVDFMTLRGGNVVNGTAGSEGFGIVYEVMLGGYSTTLGAGDLFRGVVVTSFVAFKATNLPDEIPALAAEVAPLMKSGIIPVADVEKYELKDFKQTFAKASEAGRSGKILLVTA